MDTTPNVIKLVTVAEMRAIEAAADRAGISYAQMMEAAGQAVAAHTANYLEAVGLSSPRILVLVGPGNNGGDGLVAGRALAERFPQGNIVFYLASPRGGEHPDGNLEKVRASGLRIIDQPDHEALRALVAGADVILDALLGTGAKLPVRGEVARILMQVGFVLEAQKSKPHIIGVDTPSGLDADTGQVDPLTLQADDTVTFEAAKVGQAVLPGATLCGRLIIESLGLPKDLPERDRIKHEFVTAQSVAQRLPERPPEANKGTFGKAMIIGGSAAYAGAPTLSALGAYRSGVGLLTVAAPVAIIPVLAGHLLEATWLPLPLPEGAPPEAKSITDSAASLAITQLPGYDALLIGPGIGRALSLYGFIESLLTFGAGKLPPTVIDADGLNMLATMDAWWPLLPPRTILTPHPGEMARLLKLKPTDDGETAIAQIQRDRLNITTAKAAEWNCVVVLKGAYTVIADPAGRAAVIPISEPALARAGTGDVLAGMIVGLLAQGLDAFDAAVAATYIHARAGQSAASLLGTRTSVLATDVIGRLPATFAEIEALRA